jgi:hypothetical protein
MSGGWAADRLGSRAQLISSNSPNESSRAFLLPPMIANSTPTIPDGIRAPTLENPQHLPPFPPILVALMSSEVQLVDLLFDGRHIHNPYFSPVCFKKLYVDFHVAISLSSFMCALKMKGTDKRSNRRSESLTGLKD